MLELCRTIGCANAAILGEQYCEVCAKHAASLANQAVDKESLSDRYPKYYKKVGRFTEIDVYATHQLFNLQDPSGCLHHASKKILLSGSRTGGKSPLTDIKEARDTLTRWIQLNE